jgi:hypothetical protein
VAVLVEAALLMTALLDILVRFAERLVAAVLETAVTCSVEFVGLKDGKSGNSSTERTVFLGGST